MSAVCRGSEEEEAWSDEEQTGGMISPTFLSSEEQYNVDMEQEVLDLDQETGADSAVQCFWCSEANGGSFGRLLKPSGTAHRTEHHSSTAKLLTDGGRCARRSQRNLQVSFLVRC